MQLRVGYDKVIPTCTTTVKREKICTVIVMEVGECETDFISSF